MLYQCELIKYFVSGSLEVFGNNDLWKIKICTNETKFMEITIFTEE